MIPQRMKDAVYAAYAKLKPTFTAAKTAVQEGFSAIGEGFETIKSALDLAKAGIKFVVSGVKTINSTATAVLYDAPVAIGKTLLSEAKERNEAFNVLATDIGDAAHQFCETAYAVIDAGSASLGIVQHTGYAAVHSAKTVYNVGATGYNAGYLALETATSALDLTYSAGKVVCETAATALTYLPAFSSYGQKQDLKLSDSKLLFREIAGNSSAVVNAPTIKAAAAAA